MFLNVVPTALDTWFLFLPKRHPYGVLQNIARISAGINETLFCTNEAVSCQASKLYPTKTMKNVLTLILIVFILTNCNYSQIKTVDKNDRMELVPEPDRHERLLGEAILKLRKLNCNLYEPDTSLSGITLRNSLSADKVIGTDNKTDNKEKYNFYSKLDRETLTLTQHPGDGKNQISIFSVSFSDKADHGYKQLNLDTFQTEKGIKLGMSKAQVVKRLGDCYAVVDSSNDFIELYYRIENPNDRTGILERHNMPIYYATYTFWKNELRYYEFGFEYP